MVFIYAKNQKILVFNEIYIENNKQINSEEFFDYIGYDIDSINFYNDEDYNQFLVKINSLTDNEGIIKNIKKYYSIPNKIIFDIEEKTPSYLIKNNNDSLFILDDLGMILDIDFLSQSIPEVELIFDDFHVYNTFNNEINLNKIFENINKIKSNNQNLLDVFTILNSFDKLNFSNELYSVSIDSSYIKIKLFSTDIFFNKNKNIKKQIEKFSKMVNNLDKNKEQISFNNISDLSQIRLGADKQIIYKEK